MTKVNDRNAPDAWARFSGDHEIGAVLNGRVSSIVGFGAFVEVADGVEGLLHHSAFADTNPSVGDDVDVRIDRIDDDTRRMSLALA